jgi:hypothetical protein
MWCGGRGKNTPNSGFNADYYNIISNDHLTTEQSIFVNEFA